MGVGSVTGSDLGAVPSCTSCTSISRSRFACSTSSLSFSPASAIEGASRSSTRVARNFIAPPNVGTGKRHGPYRGEQRAAFVGDVRRVGADGCGRLELLQLFAAEREDDAAESGPRDRTVHMGHGWQLVYIVVCRAISASSWRAARRASLSRRRPSRRPTAPRRTPSPSACLRPRHPDEMVDAARGAADRGSAPPPSRPERMAGRSRK